MPIHNADIAAIFSVIADLLEIQQANPFRIRAYRNAARFVGELGRDVRAMLARGEDLTQLPKTDTRLGKAKRLLNAKDYGRVFDSPDARASHQHLLQLAKINDGRGHRLGLVISKKNVRLAVHRNRIKRVAREIFRTFPAVSHPWTLCFWPDATSVCWIMLRYPLYCSSSGRNWFATQSNPN